MANVSQHHGARLRAPLKPLVLFTFSHILLPSLNKFVHHSRDCFALISITLLSWKNNRNWTLNLPCHLYLVVNNNTRAWPLNLIGLPCRIHLSRCLHHRHVIVLGCPGCMQEDIFSECFIYSLSNKIIHFIHFYYIKYKLIQIQTNCFIYSLIKTKNWYKLKTNIN